MLDNIANLLLAVSLLAAVFEFPTEFALRYMVPGTAIGVLVGDLMFFAMALHLARRTGRHDITAMPLGLDTPSTFGMVFFVLGPAFVEAKATLPVAAAARHTWHIGICAILISGVFKLACAAGSGWIRRLVPRAGLLGSLTAIALVLISFLPLVEILRTPVVGLVALAIILSTLIGRVPLPGRIPGTLAALIIAGGMYHLLHWGGWLQASAPEINPADGLLPTGWLEVFRLEWWHAGVETLRYLPVVLPFALATVVGGIDCTESAAAAGDDYDTAQVVAVEALATLVAGFCGGVIQSTPYIGHPAYKAMGGRAGYTLATALFVGSAGLLGYFGYLYTVIPRPAVFPILVFIGLEITAQSFASTPKRHFPAVAMACIPALAYLALIYVDKLMPANPAQLSPALRQELQIVRILANGYIVTSLLWASALAAMIDRRLPSAAAYLAVAACCALFGIIHSPLQGSPVFLPWQLPSEPQQWVLRFAVGYLLAALVLLVIHRASRHLPSSHHSDVETQPE